MFTKIVEFSLKNRGLVLFLYMAVILYGSLVITKMPVDVFPDLNKPTVTLLTEAPGFVLLKKLKNRSHSLLKRP